MRIAGLVAGCEHRSREPREWRHVIWEWRHNYNSWLMEIWRLATCGHGLQRSSTTYVLHNKLWLDLIWLRLVQSQLKSTSESKSRATVGLKCYI